MNRRIIPKKASVLLGLLLAAAGPMTAKAGTAEFNFNTDPTGDLTIYGNNPEVWRDTGGNPGGFLSITDAVGGQSTAIVFDDFDNGGVVKAFTFSADVRMGNGTSDRPADGFSISYARLGDPVLETGSGFAGGVPEAGTTTGIAIGFDTWQGNALPDGPDIEGVIVRVDDKTVLRYAMPTRHGACTDVTSLQTGPRNAALEGAPDELCWAKVEVELDEAGKLTVKFKGATILDGEQTEFFPSAGRLVLAGRTGGANQNHHIDNIRITTVAAVDTSPPTAPTNLQGTSVGARRVALSWGESTDDGGRVAYQIERNGEILSGTVSTTTFADLNVKPSTAYTYRVRALDVAGNQSGWISVSVNTVAEVQSQGFLLGQIYDNIGGTDVGSLLFAENFPDNPDRGRYLNGISFGETSGFGDTFGANFGIRIAGVLRVPVNGDYHFFVRSDDASQFFLNTAGAALPNPLTELAIAEEIGCCNPFREPDADNNTGQTTFVPITLQAGRDYGFVFLVKEGGGGDWGQVAMRRVGDSTPAASLQPIRGGLVTGVADPVGAVANITQQPQSQTIVGNESVTFSVTAETASPYTTQVVYQWYRNAAVINGATSPTYTIASVPESENNAMYSVLVAVPGKSVTSSEATLTVTADTKLPTVSSVTNPDLFTLLVAFSEPVTSATASVAGNYTISGGVTVSSVSLLDSRTVRIKTSQQAPDTAYTLTVSNVRDNAGNAIAPASQTAFRTFEWVPGTALSQRWAGRQGGDHSAIDAAVEEGILDTVTPTATTRYTEFSTPWDLGDNYLGRIQTYFAPQVTGDYVFFVSADDHAYLYLSTDANPANMKKIASEPQWNGRHQWVTEDRRGAMENRSDTWAETEWPGGNTIRLTAGQRYYMQIIWREGGGGDGAGATFKLASEADPDNGAATRLTSDFIGYYMNPQAGPPTITQRPQGKVFDRGENITLSVAAGGLEPLSYQWYQSKVAIPGATSKDLVLNNAGPRHVGDYMVAVSNALGSTSSFPDNDVRLIMRGAFVIEVEDYNYDGGKHLPAASVMPYLGGAYEGLAALAGIDYSFDDDAQGEAGANAYGPRVFDVGHVATKGPEADRNRGSFEVTVSYAIGWSDAGEWLNYTRTFPTPAREYYVLGGLAFDSRAEGAINMLLGKVANPTTANQTVTPVGQFLAPGTGGWSNNDLVPLRTEQGEWAKVSLGGTETLRLTFNKGDGDADYFLFYEAGTEPADAPRITGIQRNANGSITIEWTGGGTLQSAPSVTGPWSPVVGATSPFTFNPTAEMLFGRIVR